jgi:hypothetical protein
MRPSWKAESVYLVMAVAKRNFLVPFSAAPSGHKCGDSRRNSEGGAAQGCLPDNRARGKNPRELKNYQLVTEELALHSEQTVRDLVEN